MAGSVLTRKSRITVLSIPLDVTHEFEIADRLEAMPTTGDRNRIALIGLWDFMRARGRSAFAKSVRSAALVLPTSKLVAFGARFLRHRTVERYMRFDFIIRILTLLERRGGTLYLVGGRPETLNRAAANLRGSFPGLHIVGRCAGYFPASEEEDVLLAIRKANPTLILAGPGLSGGDAWPYLHRSDLGPGIAMWSGDCFEVFAGRKKRTSRALWKSGLDFLPQLIRKPWRLLRAFVYAWFFLLLLAYRIRRL
jgi:N-acetylglucosaminyldiphosphoundecaprenol N-acetyl-beta-D-mannosaminyltransferase